MGQPRLSLSENSRAPGSLLLLLLLALLCDVGLGLQVRTTIGNILEADHGKTFVTFLEVVFTSARVRSRQKESAWRLY